MKDTSITVIVGGADDIEAPLRTPEHPGIEIIGRVPTGNEAVARVLTDIPDVLLLDVRIDQPDARAVCRRIREWAPATRVLAVTPFDTEQAYTTVVAGAAGVVLLDADDDTVATAIAEVTRGESLLLSRMALRLLHDIDAWAERSADPLYPPPTLTATEREVLGRIGHGAEPATIAEIHSVTSHLVNLHTGYAVAKLHRSVLGSERIAAAQ